MPNSSLNDPVSNKTFLYLDIKLGEPVPSKKNRHFPGSDGKIKIDQGIKQRMKRLENAIVLALYSRCQTTESAMDSECRKQLRTLSLNLCDDSVREIPQHYWCVEYVPKGQEGVTIQIQEL